MTPQEIITGIRSIYSRFPVHRALQEHMYRCAAFAELIADNWKGPVLDRPALIAYMLVHDLGNIVKCDFEAYAFYGDDVRSDPNSWKRRKRVTMTKYSDQARRVTLAFLHDLGVDNRVMDLVVKQDQGEERSVVPDWECKVGTYSDMRIGPSGVVTLAERVADLLQRRAERKFTNKEDAQKVFDPVSREILEREVASQCTIPMEKIDDRAIEPYFRRYVEPQDRFV